MNPILHKTLALMLSTSLLATYSMPAFAERVIISEQTTLSDVDYKNETGGVFLNESDLTTSNVNFSGNSIPVETYGLGGAIENKDYQASLNIYGGSFTNNTANAGGALFLRGNTVIKDAAFTQNKVTGDEAGAGAIYLTLHNEGLPLNTLQMDNVSFTNNSAQASNAEGGGAVGLFSKADLTNITFTGNTVEGGTGGGGAMFLGAESLTTLSANTFKDNTSSINGGALATREYSLANNKAATLDITGSSFTGNKATEKGGAFYNTFYNSDTKEGFVSISNTSFTNNEAKDGGAIFNSGNPDKGGNKAALTLAQSTFEGNKASQNGGAIYNAGNLDISGSTFKANQATNYGGAMYINTLLENGTLTGGITNITDSTFDGNSSASLGGALFVHNGETNVKNSQFINNSAEWSGAIFTASNANMVLSIEDSLFENNTAKDTGALSAMSKTTVKNTTFKGNTATETADGGGAMFVGSIGKVWVDGSTFESNTSATRGGALSSRNAADGNNKDATLDITNTTFTANKAATEGGAIDNYLYNSNNAAGSVYVANSTFDKNEAANGGAIYNHGELGKNEQAAAITVKDSSFTGNTATTNGGAIYNMAQAVLNLEGNNTFADNTANGVANDIYNDGTLNINSGTTTLAGGITGSGSLNVKSSAVLNLGQTSAQAGNIVFDNGATLAVEFGNNAMGNLKANTITIGESESDSAKLLVTLSRDFLTDTTGISHDLTNGTATTNGSFAMADASNALYDVTFDNNVVTAVRKTQEETSQEIIAAGGNSNDINVINAFTTSSDMGSEAANKTADIINNLAQTDVTAAVQAANAVAPEVASAKQVVHGSVTREVFNSLTTRMDTVAQAPSAFALGDDQTVRNQGNYAVWMQGLLNKSHKEATATDAFTGRSTGLAFGVDGWVAEDILLGAGYAYTHTNVSTTGRHDRILGDNFFLYGQYRPSQFFVQASLGYGNSKYEEDKYLPGLNVDADYHIKSYSAQAVAGYEVTENVIPTFGLRYLNLQQEGYTDSSDQSVAAEQNNFFTGILGVTLKNEYRLSSALELLPQVHAGLSYDLVADQAQGNVVLPNGSNYSVKGERLHRLGFEAGASVAARLADNWEALLGYEGNFRQDYSSHTGTLKVRYMF